MPEERFILLATTDSGLPPKLIDALRHSPQGGRIRVGFTLSQLEALVERYPPHVMAVDESLLDGSEVEVRKFSAIAPLILLARPDRFATAAKIITFQDVECIAQVGEYASLLAAMVERHARWAGQTVDGTATSWSEMPPEFAEVLRHEINNPLTGILGNAEMVLVHRDRLPAVAVQRLETVVDLAVRLRETIRRLSVTREIHAPDVVNCA